MAINPRTGIAAFPSYGGGTGTGTAGYTAPAFNSSAYGKIPNPTATPRSLYEEAQAADPALTALGTKSTGVINSQLSGTLSPETIKTLQDNAATFGVANGMPGSGLQQNRGLRDLGLSVEQMQNQGLGNYQNALKSLSSMQLDPSLVSGLNTYNNQLAAAPDPAAAAAQEEALYQSHYGQSRAAQAEDAARAEALYQTHYAQNQRAGGTQQYPSSGYPSAGGGSSSMFKSNTGSKSTAPNYGVTVSGSNGVMVPQGSWYDRSAKPGQWTSPTGVISDSAPGIPISAGGYTYMGDPSSEPAYNTPGVYMGDQYGNGVGDPSLAGDPYYFGGQNYDPITDTYGATPANDGTT